MIDVKPSSAKPTPTAECCGLCACTVEPLAHPKYSFGMLLEARSLVLEHRYHAMRMNTHNIRLHDFGTVCGLRVDKHPSPQCVNTCAILRPGLGLDCCGREIVVPEDLFVPLSGRRNEWLGQLRLIEREPCTGIARRHAAGNAREALHLSSVRPVRHRPDSYVREDVRMLHTLRA